jgi:hypothetical protein
MTTSVSQKLKNLCSLGYTVRRSKYPYRVSVAQIIRCSEYLYFPTSVAQNVGNPEYS